MGFDDRDWDNDSIPTNEFVFLLSRKVSHMLRHT